MLRYDFSSDSRQVRAYVIHDGKEIKETTGLAHQKAQLAHSSSASLVSAYASVRIKRVHGPTIVREYEPGVGLSVQAPSSQSL